MSESLKGKVVLITGASSGFGADTARLFARQGCVVALAARRVDRLRELVEEIRHAGGEAMAIPMNITQRVEIEKTVRTVLDAYGRIDILFNNAGFGRLQWLEELDPELDIEAMLNVNLTGLILVTRAVLPHMYRQRAGHVINMSSIAGWVAAPLYTIYSASKYGVRGFTDALRRETAPFGVKVSGIYPGPAVTEFSQHSGSNVIKKKLKLPGFLYLSSEAVARRIVRLASHPRRNAILPWYYHIVIALTRLFPGLVDLILDVGFVRRFHLPEGDPDPPDNHSHP